MLLHTDRDYLQTTNLPSDDALQLAAQAWCDPETEHTVMDPVLCMAFARRVDLWIEDARRYAGNEEFYRGLLDECAKHIGIEAYTADDGTVLEDPVRLKIPELVKRLCARII